MRPPKAIFIKALFASMLVLLPLQLGAKYIGSEPWPAVFLPSFHGVPREAGEFVVRKPYIKVFFDDGRSASVEVAQLLEDAPYSHRATIMTFNFDPKMAHSLGSMEWVQVRAQSFHLGIEPDVVRWLRGRLAAMFPGRGPVRMEVVWASLVYEIRDDSAVVTVVPDDTLNVDLR